MKKSLQTLLLLLLSAVPLLSACSGDSESYAESRKRERRQIQSFLENGIHVADPESGQMLLDIDGPINVLTVDEFFAKDSVTDVSNNEFVLFSGSGIYMQIVRKGSGEKLKSDETTTVICRYTEYNIAADSIQSTNNITSYEGNPDMMTVTNILGTFTASFTQGLMRSLYGAQVPSGWLFPLTYIHLGRQNSVDSEIAKVRLVIPSTQGQTDAQNNVYPCLYEISYQRGR